MSKVPGSAQEMLRSIHSSYRSGPISGSMYGHAFVPVRLGKDLYDEMSLVDYSMQVIFFSTLPIFTDPLGLSDIPLFAVYAALWYFVPLSWICPNP